MYYIRQDWALPDPILYKRAFPENKLDYFIEAEMPEVVIPIEYEREVSFGYDRALSRLYVKYSNNRTYIVPPDLFLKAEKPRTAFINTPEEVQELVHQTFLAVTGKRLRNIVIKMCDKEELEKHNLWQDGVLGVSLNHNGFAPGEIFVIKDFLDRLLITIGHEIGHIYTPSLADRKMEEAKAFAFQIAWVRAIKENNIGNLANSVRNILPANNGLHNVAFDFVLRELKEKKPFEIHKDIVKGSLDDLV